MASALLTATQPGGPGAGLLAIAARRAPLGRTSRALARAGPVPVAMPQAFVAAIRRLEPLRRGVEHRGHLPVRLTDEILDGLLAPDDQGQRGRLHPAHGHEHPTAGLAAASQSGEGPGAVHAD